jgi:vanillate O-demethylase ferredoxin subunit
VTDVRLAGVRYACEGIRLFELGSPTGAPLPAVAPGSVVELRLPNDAIRSYFIAERTRRGTYVIGVRRDPDGSTSKYLHDKVRVGASMRIESVSGGAFESGPVRSTIVAEDVGIFFAWPMIRELDARGVDWELHYDAWSRADAALLVELVPFGARVRTHVRSENHGKPLAWSPLVAALESETRVYVCGPPEMATAAAAAALESARDIAGALRFTSTLTPRNLGPVEFEVVLARSNRRLAVRTGETILDAILAAGIDVPKFCRGGICGTCRTRVLEGVPTHLDAVLSSKERAAGDVMMICRSRTSGRQLVLDV